jgi:serine/threonine protein kinase
MSHEKIVEKNLADNIRTEIQIMLDLAGKPHIMPLLKIINRQTDTVLVFPYVPGRDLFRFMRQHKNPKGYLSEYEAHVIFK